jgi:hypothetical protein
MTTADTQALLADLSAQSLPLFAVVGMPANPALFTFVWIVLRTDGGERRGSAVKVCS